MILVGLAVRLNAFAIENVTVALCDSPLPDPVIVTVNDPDVAVATQFRDEVADVPSVTLVGLSEHVRPVLGEIAGLRLIAPEKPLIPVIVKVDDPPLGPAKIERVVGLAEIEKSWTLYAIVVA